MLEMENNNKESFKLLAVSSSNSDSEVPEFVLAPTPTRKKRLKRRVRSSSRARGSSQPCHCRGRTVGLCIAVVLLFCWLITLTWLAIVLHAELRHLDENVRGAWCSANGVPQHTGVSRRRTRDFSLRLHPSLLVPRAAVLLAITKGSSTSITRCPITSVAIPSERNHFHKHTQRAFWNTDLCQFVNLSSLLPSGNLVEEFQPVTPAETGDIVYSRDSVSRPTLLDGRVHRPAEQGRTFPETGRSLSPMLSQWPDVTANTSQTNPKEQNNTSPDSRVRHRKNSFYDPIAYLSATPHISQRLIAVQPPETPVALRASPPDLPPARRELLWAALWRREDDAVSWLVGGGIGSPNRRSQRLRAVCKNV
uniref:Uncharacterized protein n=1 Tax=Timema bartmani TaxID=61472 RepID=A0A7R9I237_9NEOP|nr:unnamed protein product [Timema bartmani]